MNSKHTMYVVIFAEDIIQCHLDDGEPSLNSRTYIKSGEIVIVTRPSCTICN